MDARFVIIWVIRPSHFGVHDDLRFGPPCQSFIYSFVIKGVKFPSAGVVSLIFDLSFDSIDVDCLELFLVGISAFPGIKRGRDELTLNEVTLGSWLLRMLFELCTRFGPKTELHLLFVLASSWELVKAGLTRW